MGLRITLSPYGLRTYNDIVMMPTIFFVNEK